MSCNVTTNLLLVGLSLSLLVQLRLNATLEGLSLIMLRLILGLLLTVAFAKD